MAGKGRLDRDIRLSRPHSMVAQERNTVDVAYPGDIVGLINRDTFRIGDTLSLRGGFEHKPLPAFQPEVFARVTPRELTKRKSFDKGLEQLINEGTVQLLLPESGVRDPIVAAVGKLDRVGRPVTMSRRHPRRPALGPDLQVTVTREQGRKRHR